MFSRWESSPITTRRLWEAVKRRIVDVPHALAWYASSNKALENRRRLSWFHQRHVGQRCVILANGPSLSRVDLGRLKGEVVFGLNRIYLLDLPFPLSYYISINELVLSQFYTEIQALPVPKFLNWNCRHRFQCPQTFFLRMRLGLRDGFTKDITQPVNSGGTVTYVALQVAFAMGFQEVVLVGLDHHYPEGGIPNVPTVRQQDDVNHFDPNYFPRGTKWQYPDLQRSEVAYAIARRMYERHGRRILDATEGGKCPVFEKVSFEKIFPG